MNIKVEGMPLTVASTLEKNMKFSLDAKPVSILILEDLSVIPVSVDL